ncbi:diguanylate cyclase [Sulfurimonas sp.]|uniref:sensor domain-containing diguanylate cyclase n=1 Tax=Sulfurimonas sp. TaxID=2022749 RepID=UPI0025F2C642|nr:diguanylate cyclase [Sulfurimonas sp.]
MNSLKKLLNTDSFKGRLRLFILNLLLFVVLVISIFLIIMTKSQLNETFKNELNAIVKMQNKAVEKWLNERELDIKFLASSVNDKNVALFFESFILNQSEFYSLAYVDKNGSTIVDSTFSTKHNYKDEIFFKEAIEGFDTISKVSISKDEKMPIIYFSSPIYDEYDRVSHVILGAVRLSSIQSIVEDFRFSKTGETFIINEKSQLLTKRKFDKDNSILKIVDKKNITNGFYKSYSNQDVFGATQKVLFDRWTIVAQISTDEMYKVFKEFVIYIFVFVVLLLMILVPLILAFSNKIEKPLKFLLHSSKKIEGGDYGYEISSDDIAHSTCEIRELTHSFNSMSSRLNGVIGELKISSTIDILSQLYNRRELLKKSSELFNQSIKAKENFAVLMIDIDFFKVINDTYGHQVGDIAITMVANTIKSSINNSDIAGRYGGEEFLVTILNRDYTVVESIFQRIRENVQKLIILNDEDSISCTCSIGVFFTSENDKQLSLEKSIEYADQALYEAKHTGRNKVVTKTL